MPNFKIIQNVNEITVYNSWVPATKFNSKDRVVDEKGNKVSADYNGLRYRIIDKRERHFSTFESIGRGFLGILAVVCSLSLALFSKSVRHLFTKSKENIRFAVLISKDNFQTNGDFLSSDFATISTANAIKAEIFPENVEKNKNPSAKTLEIEKIPKEPPKDTDSTENVIEVGNSPKNLAKDTNLAENTIKAEIFPKDSTKDTEKNPLEIDPNSNESLVKKISQPPLSAEQMKIIEEFTPQMVEALGGVDEVLGFPILKDFEGFFHQLENLYELMTAPVMRGYHSNGPFLMFCYCDFQKEKVCGEYISKHEDGWKGEHDITGYSPQLDLGFHGIIPHGSKEEWYVLDRITRLLKGEAVGILNKYPNPKDKKSFTPDDAILSDKELDKYMDLDTCFYERQPKEFSDLSLADKSFFT